MCNDQGRVIYVPIFAHQTDDTVKEETQSFDVQHFILARDLVTLSLVVYLCSEKLVVLHTLTTVNRLRKFSQSICQPYVKE